MSIEYINQLYMSNPEVKGYIDRFAAERNVPVSQVLNYKIVAEYVRYKVSKYG